MRTAIEGHLQARHVARVLNGAIIGMAVIVVLEHRPPRVWVVAGTLLATAVAVGLAELYSEVVGTQTRHRRRIARDQAASILQDSAAVAFGVSFPVIFFVLAAVGLLELHTAFTVAKWSGLGLIGFFGFLAGRLAGAGVGLALTEGLAGVVIGGALIAFKALVH
jgi:hypothetical protein